MAIYGKDGVELRLPTHLDLPCSEGEVMPAWTFRVPDHTDLPDSDGAIVENTQELPQAILLTGAIRPVLDRIHRDGQYFIGGNSAIYWDLLDPPLKGAIGPDWFYVPDVPPFLVAGNPRRSYVLWKERVAPEVVVEVVSGDGSIERDATPHEGKFWIYEHGVKATYYAIFDPARRTLDLFVGNPGRYRPVPANDRGHFPLPRLGVELGIWDGTFQGMELPWLRWFDRDGILLPSPEERLMTEIMRADDEARRADEAARRADEAARRAEALAARLRAMGIDPDEVAGPGSA